MIASGVGMAEQRGGVDLGGGGGLRSMSLCVCGDKYLMKEAPRSGG